MTDCDMHSRLSFAGYDIEEVQVGILPDVASSLDNLFVLYRQREIHEPTTGENEPDKQETHWMEASFTDPNIEAPRVLPKSDEGMKSGQTSARYLKSFPRPIPNRRRSWFSKPHRWEEDSHMNSVMYTKLVETVDSMQNSKFASKGGRNVWQTRQVGGEGEPYYRDPAGFEKALGMAVEHGRGVFAEKWGHRDCNLGEVGLKGGDEWKVERDW